MVMLVVMVMPATVGIAAPSLPNCLHRPTKLEEQGTTHSSRGKAQCRRQVTRHLNLRWIRLLSSIYYSSPGEHEPGRSGTPQAS